LTTIAAPRYLVVDTGGWLERRTELLSPMAIKTINWDKRTTVPVTLTRQQIKASTHKAILYRHYQRPGYWQ
jgi:hypothetical protein